MASFLGAFIDRSLDNKSIIKPASFCNFCKKPLRKIALIPVFGFLFEKGKCHYCGSKVPKIYPIMEIVLGFFYLICFYFYGFSYNALLHILIGSTLFAASYMDYKSLEIYDLFSYIILLISSIYYMIKGDVDIFILSILFALILFIIFKLINIFYKDGNGFGDGDVYLIASVVYFFGFPNGLYFLTSSFVIGSLIGIFLLIIKKNSKTTLLPFVPFLFLGHIIYIIIENYYLIYF